MIAEKIGVAIDQNARTNREAEREADEEEIENKEKLEAAFEKENRNTKKKKKVGLFKKTGIFIKNTVEVIFDSRPKTAKNKSKKPTRSTSSLINCNKLCWSNSTAIFLSFIKYICSNHRFQVFHL